jgi:D-3-phosphoglycerate dehydrogenase / 2-oxoglutarate reductase
LLNEPQGGTVVVTEPWNLAGRARELLATIGTVHEGPFDRATLLTSLGSAVVLFVRLGHQIDGEVLAAAPRLRFIGSPTTGTDHIDLEAAAARGVAVVTLRGEVEFLRTVKATPEHTWALLLALARKLPTAARASLRPPWDRDAHRGTELAGKRLGIFGLGRVGQIVAGYAQAFEMSVSAFDTRDREAPGVELVTSLEALLERSDVLLVHVPLEPATRHIIGARELALLPPGALLVNTARGAILDETAVVRSLEEDHLAGVAVDVLEGELEPGGLQGSPLLAYAREHPTRAIVTPHIAGATWESMQRTEVFLAQRLRDLAVGGA